MIVSAVFFVAGIWYGVYAYKIGRKHGIIIGRAELAKELLNLGEGELK